MSVPPSRPDGQLNLNLSTLSPIVEPKSAPSSSKSPFGNSKASSNNLAGIGSVRLGAGSPSHEQTSRLFPKRTRELATPTGIPTNIWGPPTSGTSTPLFEIPESPAQDGFPDLIPLTETGINSPARRGRAGTLPSRISPIGTVNGSGSIPPKTSRPTPSTSPFRPSSTSAAETAFNAVPATANGSSALLSRLRAGSMPQRANALTSGAFTASPFSSTWGSRSRGATLTSIHSADDSSSPQQPTQIRNGLADPGVRTLDYLGLAERSHPADADLLRSDSFSKLQTASNVTAAPGNHGARSASATSRFRSFSVNTQLRYGSSASETARVYPPSGSGTMTPSAAAAIEAEYEAVQERVRLHNQAVQAFALNANAARPRARTAGLIEAPQRAALRNLGQLQPGELEPGEYDTAVLNMQNELGGLTDSLYELQIQDKGPSFDGVEEVGSQISRSLWIGSIPNSTTVSSLDAIFASYGPIESTRVLTHKNCGFVNYENVDDAIHARQILNGKEIFPGAGPVRIGFAKAPTSATLLSTGLSNGPNADPFATSRTVGTSATDLQPTGVPHPSHSSSLEQSAKASSLNLAERRSDILQFVQDFGAQPADLSIISTSITNALTYTELRNEIPPISEPSATRVFDAPRLREIRKRIDNGTCPPPEIEQIALDMLPEIAELSSDYLGNTVVQKLFEFCAESTKEQMLACIAPHLAEIGVHKNGTWAAQKIIEVCKSESQTQMIVAHLRPFTVPLILDQYGNYVLQCCLKFGPPYNDFIFETMLSQLWEIAQGRFGARAMRACLESHNATQNQQRMLAAAIALHAVQLATNANGALLLTWYLDTCNFPRRRSVLVPRLIPQLVLLCTHKVAYLTVLKVVNQRNEPEARELIVRTLFFHQNDAVLEQILSEQASGVTLVFKILTNHFLDDSTRPEILQTVATVLERIKAQPNQGYKRLMDEVGLSTRSSQPTASSYPHGPAAGDRAKPAGHPNSYQYSGNYANGLAGASYDNATITRPPASTDLFRYGSFGVGNFQNQQPGFGHVQYPAMGSQPQFNDFQGRNNSSFMNNNNYPTYGTPPSGTDYGRLHQQTGSPLPFPAQMSPLMNGSGFAAQNFGSPTANGGMYGYNTTNGQGAGGYYFSPPAAAIHAGGRGRRMR